MSKDFTCSIPNCSRTAVHHVIFPDQGIVARCDACRNRAFEYPHAFPVVERAGESEEVYTPFDWPPPKRDDYVAFIGESESHIDWESMVRGVIEESSPPPPLFTVTHGIWFPPNEAQEDPRHEVMELPPIPDLIDAKNSK